MYNFDNLYFNFHIEVMAYRRVISLTTPQGRMGMYLGTRKLTAIQNYALSLGVL